MAAGCLHGKTDLDVRLRNVGQGLVGPFDEADAFACEIFVQPGFEEFVWCIESIKIKVIQIYSRNYIRF